MCETTVIPMTHDQFAAMYMTPDRYKAMREEIASLKSTLEGYEQWEANLVLKANWEATPDGLPALTYPLYDELMALQDRRNKALGRGPYRQR